MKKPIKQKLSNFSASRKESKEFRIQQKNARKASIRAEKTAIQIANHIQEIGPDKAPFTLNIGETSPPVDGEDFMKNVGGMVINEVNNRYGKETGLVYDHEASMVLRGIHNMATTESKQANQNVVVIRSSDQTFGQVPQPEQSVKGWLPPAPQQ